MKVNLHQNVGHLSGILLITLAGANNSVKLYHLCCKEEERGLNCKNERKLEASRLSFVKITSFQLISRKRNSSGPLEHMNSST